MKILIVEDDQPTGELLSKTLSENRYTVDLATTGAAGLELTEVCDYDLIVLDVQLPEMNGIEVCQRIRARGIRTPVLMLTAAQTDDTMVTGLDAGADDYVLKTGSLDQLLARIRSLLRRRGDAYSPVLSWGDLCLDPVSGRVTYQQQEFTLRHKEYILLELFLRYPERIFSRNAILDHLWTIDNFPSESAVTNLIKDLRQRLTAVGLPKDLIETVYGFGYRLKAAPDVQTLPPASQAEPARNNRLDECAASNRLKEKFQTSTQRQLRLLEETTQLLHNSEITPEQRRLAQRAAHQLAGSLGMFGYSQASEIARSIDRLFAQESCDASQATQLMQWLAELRDELCQPPILTIQSNRTGTPLVLAISEDDRWAEALQQEARNWNIQVETVPDWSPAQRQLILETPAAVVIEWNPSALPVSEFTAITEIKQQFPEIPVVVLADREDLADRVAISRLDVTCYLAKPISAAQLLATVTQWLPQNRPVLPAKVLIVDDDPLIHPVLTRLLQPWGLEVISLEQPEQFWQVLTQTRPDLVLLDIEMPTFNGIELCRVVRQDRQYGHLPILVITAHTEADALRQVFDAGADDLIRKPIIESELVVRVMGRLERSRLLQRLDLLHQQRGPVWQQAVVDPLTQLPHRQAFAQFLQQVWQQLQDTQSVLALILAEVDEFQAYQDCEGRVARTCLQQIAKLLQQCVKPGDQVAQYGSAKFAVVLPHTSLSGAIKVAERIQQAVAHLQLPHSPTAQQPQVSLSLGITGTHAAPDKLPDHLIAKAEQALYAARKERNTYCLYPL